MQMGSQLHAPEGYGVLHMGIVYYLLRNDAETKRVLLIEFCPVSFTNASNKKVNTNSKGGKKVTGKNGNSNAHSPSCIEGYKTVMSFMTTQQFESGIDEGAIQLCTPQRDLPPWFGDTTINDLSACDLRHPDRKVSHQDRTARLIAHLQPLIQNLNLVLASTQPDKMVNAHARACHPPQNESRFRTAFYTYICFGLSPWALHYAVQKIGHWDRGSNPKKLGRPSTLRGAQNGHPSNDPKILKLIEEGYRRFSRPGKTLAWIYSKTMPYIFGCVTQTDASGRKIFVHPAGDPFPTFDQFVYRVDQFFSLKERQIQKYGEDRVRNRLTHSKGRFTESVSSLMERTEQDAYCCKEVCIGYDEHSHLPALWVVRIRCIASGMIVGIGFSFGAERASAYRMALFCAAIDKVLFAQLYGLELMKEEWPGQGLSPHVINDRGPGSTDKADARDEASQFLIKEGTPSYSGQSKANVETLHPKAIKSEGRPTYKLTRKSIPQLAQQEILRAVRDNNSTDISDRLNYQSFVEGVFPTPVGLWNHLNDRGRSHAAPVRFEQAVRMFLTPIEVTVHDDAVYFLDARFSSPSLTESGLLQKAHNTGRFKLPGYVMDVCVRHLWVDIGHKLIQVDAQLAIRDDTGQLYVSVVELEQIQHIRRARKLELKQHKQAGSAEYEGRFQEVSGMPFEQSITRSGRSKRGKKASISERQKITPYLQPKSRFIR